jgi:hypothetical protein
VITFSPFISPPFYLFTFNALPSLLYSPVTVSTKELVIFHQRIKEEIRKKEGEPARMIESLLVLNNHGEGVRKER